MYILILAVFVQNELFDDNYRIFLFISGKVRNNIPYQLNIPHQERSTNFFPDNTSPVSPINLPRTESSFGNSFRFHNRPSTSYDIHHTFSFSDKPQLQEQDSDGTSGIHTMEEIPSPFFSGNVVQGVPNKQKHLCDISIFD